MRKLTTEERHFLDGARRAGEMLAGIANGDSLAATVLIHGLADATAKQYQSASKCAGLGCNTCCHAADIKVMHEELFALAALMTPEAWDRALAMDGMTQEQADDVRCPVLDPATGGCSAYENRPMVCRTYMVVTPASHCHDGKPIKIIGAATMFMDAVARTIWGADPYRRTLWRELVAMAKARRDQPASP